MRYHHRRPWGCRGPVRSATYGLAVEEKSTDLKSLHMQAKNQLIVFDDSKTCMGMVLLNYALFKST